MEATGFFETLQDEVRAHAESVGQFTETAFFELATGYLAEAGSIAEVTLCHYEKGRTKVSGYAFVQDEATLDLYVAQFDGGAAPRKLGRKEIDAWFSSLELFFNECTSPAFAPNLETSHPIYGLARQVVEELAGIRRVRFFVITDGTLSGRVKDVASKTRAGREWLYRVWDVDRLAKVMTTGEPEQVVVDFVESFGAPLRCLPAGNDSADVTSFLAAVPGNWLSDIYGRWSGRLLEQNVRAFLQLKGGVNQGIRSTILTEPQYFFPYNNGISATASKIVAESRDGIYEIREMHDFQIVNGGQTTASLFNAVKRDGADVSRIHVQMKLSVVALDKVNELVPKISRYANSQNKVGDADFFSNHPFHVRVESLSQRLWAPAAGSSQVQTHWFYERVRGQYANAQLHLSSGAKKKFALQNPRQQLIVKTDLAKYLNTFRMLPHDVSKGAQKNFLKFAEYISKAWDADEATFSQVWFQNVVAMTIMFRSTERLVEGAAWYAKGFRAQIVTYTLALLAAKLKARQMALDYMRVWRDQLVSGSFSTGVTELAQIVQSTILESSARNGVSNVTEWCKRPGCWDDVQKIEYPFVDAFRADALSVAEVRDQRAGGQRDQKLHSDAEAQVAAVELGAEYWRRVLIWARKDALVGHEDIKVLTVAAAIPAKLPNAIQSRRLLALHASYQRAGGR